MHKLLIVVLVSMFVIGFALTVWAQADAGFMDSPLGTGYACFDHVYHHTWVGWCAGEYGPKSDLPCDCSAY